MTIHGPSVFRDPRVMLSTHWGDNEFVYWDLNWQVREQDEKGGSGKRRRRL